MSIRISGALLLRLAAAGLFVGATLKAYFYGLPWRNLVWDEELFGPLVHLFYGGWGEWVNDPAVDRSLVGLDYAAAAVYAFAALAVMLRRRLQSRFWRAFIFAAGLLIFTDYALAAKAQFFRIGYLVEHALRLATPFLLLAWWPPRPTGRETYLLRWLVALTFFGHGLYALGIHPVPQHFVLMTTEGLHFILTGEVANSPVEAARYFLLAVGILDVLVAVLLVIPSSRTGRLALYWVLPWAILTTLARLWASFHFSSTENYLTYWLPEFLLRWPHVALPALLWRWTFHPPTNESATPPPNEPPSARPEN